MNWGTSYTFKGSKESDNGLIDSQEDVGGWPLYFACTSDIPVDTDEDGIPDVWEATYSNLEDYLFSKVSHLY